MLAAALLFSCATSNAPQKSVNKGTTTANPSLSIDGLRGSKVVYCISDLNLLQKGIKAYDTTNLDYRLMKECVALQLDSLGLSWEQADKALTRRLTLGIDAQIEHGEAADSLPYAAWDLCMARKYDYVVTFYGYTHIQSRGVSPNSVAASVGITALGVLSGLATGVFVYAIPKAQNKSAMKIYCTVFAVRDNRRVAHASEAIESFNTSDITGQINGMYHNLFRKL